MDKITKIELDGVLPAVFAAERCSDKIRASETWCSRLDLERGRLHSVNAGSGMGKTSLCSFIYGLRSDYEGTIRFDGHDIRKFSASQWSEIRCRHLAYVPQDLELFPQLTAIENILLKNSLTEHCTESRIREMLDMLGIADRADSLVARLSVGQRQRVAIVRALCQPFDFIMLDEPVSHLDPANNEICADLITEIADRNGAAVISTSVGNPLLLPPERTIDIAL